MTYEQFLDRLEQELCLLTGKGESIRRVRVLKNNGVKLDGFSCCVEGRREQPTVYVNHYFSGDMRPGDLKKLAEQILKVQKESLLARGGELLQVLKYENMKGRIFYRLISREMNEELLRDVPHLLWLDLAIVFYLKIPEEIIDNATALIHNSHMERWGIDIKELYRTAAENMAGIPVMLEPMEQILRDCGLDSKTSGMYVLGIRGREYGAAVMLNPGVLRMCFERIGEEYYVLPSSIHEVILLPASCSDSAAELEGLVREVNETCISREDYLSGHVYRNISGSGELKL